MDLNLLKAPSITELDLSSYREYLTGEDSKCS
jgi:hypothetical protein